MLEFVFYIFRRFGMSRTQFDNVWKMSVCDTIFVVALSQELPEFHHTSYSVRH